MTAAYRKSLLLTDTLATFARTGTVNTTTGNLILATQIYVDNEFE